MKNKRCSNEYCIYIKCIELVSLDPNFYEIAV